jgi:phosphoglycolate phosphatase
MTVSSVFFDLDGTLTDPLEGITRSIQHALVGMQIPCPPLTELACTIGPPLRSTFADLMGVEMGDVRVEQAVQIYRDRFASVGLYENSVYAGVPEMLQRLSTASLPLYLATSKPRVYAERILEHFDLAAYFLRIYGSELDGRHDDKSELLAFLLEEEGIAAERAVMVGDRKQDILAAQINGVRSLGVTYGYGTTRELCDAGAGLLCHTPEQVVDSILGLLETHGTGRDREGSERGWVGS